VTLPTGVGEIQFGGDVVPDHTDFICTRGVNGFSNGTSGGVETPGPLSCSGTDTNSNLPNLQLGVFPLNYSAVQVVTGDRHACALQPDNSVQCWGDNLLGQLGYAAVGLFATPNTVLIGPGLAPYQATLIAAGNGFTCAAGFPNQDVSCWGDNSLDQLGIAGADQSSPTEVSATTTPINALELATNALANFVCVIQYDDTVFCWGDNSQGQLGLGPVPPLAPTPVSASATALGRAHGITVGQNHACALYYGNANDIPITGSDPVPNPSPSPLPAPSPLPPPTDKGRYSVFCWGDNSFGQLGTGLVGVFGTPQTTPTATVTLYP
jgi:alpha-tubulin suppressor-like RCC1 family protein